MNNERFFTFIQFKTNCRKQLTKNFDGRSECHAPAPRLSCELASPPLAQYKISSAANGSQQCLLQYPPADHEQDLSDFCCVQTIAYVIMTTMTIMWKNSSLCKVVGICFRYIV